MNLDAKEKLTEQEKHQVEALLQSTSRRSSRFIAVVAFLSGIGLMINVRLGVRLSVTELFAPFLFLAMSSGLQRLLTNNIVRTAIVFLVVQMVGVMLSDFYSEVPFEDTIKGLARPIFILALLINFGLLFVQGTRFIIPLFFGLFAGTILHLFFNTGDDPYDFTMREMSYAFFVFRVNPIINIGVALACFFLFKRFKPLVFIIVGAATAVSIVFSTRASGLFWLLTLAGLIYASRPSLPDPRVILDPRRAMLKIFIGGFCLSYFCYYSYREIMLSGLIETVTQKSKTNKKELENPIGYGPIGFLISGRTEVFGSMLMIADSPFLGHGTSSMCGQYFIRAYRTVGDKGMTERKLMGILYGRISTGHSILFHGWAANGVLVLPFWIFTLWTLFRFATVLVVAKDRFCGMFLLFISLMFWDIFFSPLSVGTRSIIPLILTFYAFYKPEMEARAIAMINASYASRSGPVFNNIGRRPRPLPLPSLNH